MTFSVRLAEFRGPLDLLLFLVRRRELAVDGISLLPIAEQFWDSLRESACADVDQAAEFLDLASTLLEIKSRLLLPRPEEEEESLQANAPAADLVHRLLEYKRFRDAANMLDERSRQWQMRLPRTADDFPASSWATWDEPVRGLEMWDLVSAYARVQAGGGASALSNIVYDDTPIHVYMRLIREQLLRRPRISLSDLLTTRIHKSGIIGMFLAILELVRHHSIRTEQEDAHGEIWVMPGEKFDADDEFGRLGISEFDAPEDLESSS